MNLSQLYYFRKLAQLEHYTKTAQELYISQPSLSSSIAAMEEELQIKLFQKTGRNVKLTKNGREFYTHVCRALDALQDGIDSAHEKNGALGGSVDIAAPASLLLNFIPELILAYRSTQRSQIKFHIHNAESTTAIIEGVQNGIYDFGFCTNPSVSNTLCAAPVSKQEYAAYVSKSSPLANKKQITLEELKDHEILTYQESSEDGQTIRKILAENEITPTSAFSDEFSISSYIAQNDELIAIAAKSTTLRQCRHLQEIPIANLPEDIASVFLIYSKKNHVTKPMERFLEFVTECMESHIEIKA